MRRRCAPLQGLRQGRPLDGYRRQLHGRRLGHHQGGRIPPVHHRPGPVVSRMRGQRLLAPGRRVHSRSGRGRSADRCLPASLDYAVYTRNVNCLPAAIAALPAVLRAHLSFAILDIEPATRHSADGQPRPAGDRPRPATGRLQLRGGLARGHGRQLRLPPLPAAGRRGREHQRPVPSPLPPAFPFAHPLARPYGGWSGPAAVEQQQGSAAITGPAGTIPAPPTPSTSTRLTRPGWRGCRITPGPDRRAAGSPSASGRGRAGKSARGEW